MTTDQGLAFAILAGTMLLFVWSRLRYDLVAVLALLVALAAGIVEPAHAFSGFSDEIVVIVASALVLSAAVSRSGIVEDAIARIEKRVTKVSSQLVVMVSAVTLLSAVVKNIGALAMMMPAALQSARRSGTPPSVFLMPMSFGALLGGLITLIGTSPNIIVSRVKNEMTGEPFGMFDYAPVGLALALTGILFLRFGYRLLPRDRQAAPTMGEALNITDYVTEAEIPAGWRADGGTIFDIREACGTAVRLIGVLRDGRHRLALLPMAILRQGDVLLLQGDPEALEQVIVKAGLVLEGHHREHDVQSDDDIGIIEAVLTADSLLVGDAAAHIALHQEYGINLLAISRSGERIERRLGQIRLAPGDVVVLQGPLGLLPERLRDLGCLPLTGRGLKLGSKRPGYLPLAILGAAMLVTALGWVPVAIAFFAAASITVLSGALPLREAYERIEWPILVMLGALLPVGDALRTTGATDLVAGWLSSAATALPPWGAVALILVAAMAVTPFLNNAATVIVLAPIAVTFAHDLGYRPEALLMAVAVGAGCDFLTPIGHQCNTLVMGPGGYRFGDYARLGAPLSILVVLVAVPMILLVWPLR